MDKNRFLKVEVEGYEEILRFWWNILIHYQEGSSTRGHMTQLTLTLTFKMPICTILAYNSYVMLY